MLDSYSALVSGVLIGMSEGTAVREGGSRAGGGEPRGRAGGQARRGARR
jgi:hypothetical protein